MRIYRALLVIVILSVALACSALPGGSGGATPAAPVAATEAPAKTQEAPPVADDLDVQWGEKAYASTEYGNPQWGAQQATGKPDTLECGDSVTAWAAAGGDSPNDWLEVHYARPMFAQEIQIYETYNPGSIVKVEAITVVADYIMVWEGQPKASSECPRVFRVPVEGVEAPLTGVRLTFDQSVIGDWNEIDAVQLVGKFAPQE